LELESILFNPLNKRRKYQRLAFYLNQALYNFTNTSSIASVGILPNSKSMSGCSGSRFLEKIKLLDLSWVEEHELALVFPVFAFSV
jgi:hypothetical protein